MRDEFARVLAAAAAGDSTAFDSLYRRTQPVLLRYLRGLVGHDSHAAEDVASETWVSVIRGLDRFRGEEDDFRAWIVTIARRRLIDASRHAARHPLELVGEPGETSGVERDAGDLALEQLATSDAIRLVSTLPPDQAEAVLLRFVVGLDTARTAELMDRSNGAVRVLAHRGLRALQARLAPESTRVV